MKNRKLLECVADIAYYAGQIGYYSGDSRTDINDFIYLANTFYQVNKDTDWNDVNYMIEIEKFIKGKLNKKETPQFLEASNLEFYF